MGEIADAQIDRILNMKSPAGYMPRHNKKGSNQMSNNVNNPCKVITGKCRLSYAHIWEPSSMNENSPAKYSACIIWPKTDKVMTEKVRAATEAAIQDGIKSKWKGKRPPESKLKLPMRDGDEERPEDEAFQGCYFINANSNKRPGVVDLARNPILDQEEIYSGCYCRFSLMFYPFSTNGNNGVAVGLNNLQKVSDGERLAGGSKVEDDFNDDYTGDLDDIM